MANTFPETLDKIDYTNLKSAVQQIEAYMRYMCERTDFAIANVTKVAAKSGNIGADVLLQLQNLQNDVSTVKNNVNSITAQITGILSDINDLKDRVSALETPS